MTKSKPFLSDKALPVACCVECGRCVRLSELCWAERRPRDHALPSAHRAPGPGRLQLSNGAGGRPQQTSAEPTERGGRKQDEKAGRRHVLTAAASITVRAQRINLSWHFVPPPRRLTPPPPNLPHNPRQPSTYQTRQPFICTD